jgi:hypothetical protein
MVASPLGIDPDEVRGRAITERKKFRPYVLIAPLLPNIFFKSNLL